MLIFQRAVALLMAAAMVFLFLVPLSLKAHNYTLAIAVVAVFLVYLGVNAWLFVRHARSSRS
jgi:amino acid transporter